MTRNGHSPPGKAFAAVSEKVGDAVPASLAGRVRGLRDRSGAGEDDWGTSNT